MLVIDSKYQIKYQIVRFHKNYHKQTNNAKWKHITEYPTIKGSVIKCEQSTTGEQSTASSATPPQTPLKHHKTQNLKESLHSRSFKIFKLATLQPRYTLTINSIEQGDRRIFSNTPNLISQMLKPTLVQYIQLRFTFLRISLDKTSTSKTGRIPNRPRLVMKSRDQRL